MFGISRTSTRRAGPRPAVPRRTAIVAAVFGVLGFALAISVRWRGEGGFIPLGNVSPVLLPFAGCLGIVMTPLFWWRDRHSDSLGEPSRRIVYLAFFVGALLWIASWPIGSQVERASAEVSRSRMLEVASAAEVYRDAVGW